MCHPKISYSTRSTIHEDRIRTYKLYDGYYHTLGQCCKSGEMQHSFWYMIIVTCTHF